jgi:thiol-disulfide isomerase/thioredoxin
MQSKINFKSGLFTGSVLGILLLVFGYYTFQKITTKAEDIANIDLYQFEYVDLDGKNISLSDYQGKHLLVNFWATWCAPCIKEFPVLNEAHQLLKEDFIFVMVSDQSINKIKAFTETKPYSLYLSKI